MDPTGPLDPNRQEETEASNQSRWERASETIARLQRRQSALELALLAQGGADAPEHTEGGFLVPLRPGPSSERVGPVVAPKALSRKASRIPAATGPLLEPGRTLATTDEESFRARVPQGSSVPFNELLLPVIGGAVRLVLSTEQGPLRLSAGETRLWRFDQMRRFTGEATLFVEPSAGLEGRQIRVGAAPYLWQSEWTAEGSAEAMVPGHLSEEALGGGTLRFSRGVLRPSWGEVQIAGEGPAGEDFQVGVSLPAGGATRVLLQL